jgi:hypothetical protein
MMSHTHRTAPTPCIEANGIRFAYRRFGHGNEITEMPQLQSADHTCGVWPSTYKVLLAGARGTQIGAVSRCHHPAPIPGRTGP